MKSYQPGKGVHACLNRLLVNGLISGLLAIAIIFAGPIQAEEKRHHGAHEHGVANLNIAIEGNSVYIEFTSPAANIVGFEHHPRTQEQKNAVKDAVNKLQKGDAIFLLSAKSESKLVNASVDTDIDKDAEHHAQEEHAHSKEEHHGHAEKHDDDHGDADKHERHSEFEAKYQFACQKPDKLSQIEVMLFRAFPGIEHIEVQLLTETKQTAMELTAKKNKIEL
ncbi:MAG: DUF2796 domain-containing protein [Desulfosarcina sp.]|jgi:hypothetical protein